MHGKGSGKKKVRNTPTAILMFWDAFLCSKCERYKEEREFVSLEIDSACVMAFWLSMMEIVDMRAWTVESPRITQLDSVSTRMRRADGPDFSQVGGAVIAFSGMKFSDGNILSSFDDSRKINSIIYIQPIVYYSGRGTVSLDNRTIMQRVRSVYANSRSRFWITA